MENAETAAEEVPPEWRERDAAARRKREAEEAQVKAAAAATVEALREATGVPLRFRQLAEAVRTTEALSEVQRAEFEILVLSGDPGRGKTVAAAWWLLQHLDGKRNSLFVSAARLSRWERYDRGEMDRLLLAPRLVIDDLGEEFNDTKGNFLAVLDETVCDRIANRRPTVITTNLTAELFFDRYGQRIRDRIREAGRFVVSAGASMRQRTLPLGEAKAS